jgi:hypothetical protein
MKSDPVFLPKDKLNYLLNLQNFQNLSSSDIFELISILTNPAENELIQAAVLPVLKIAGKDAVSLLLNQWKIHLDSFSTDSFSDSNLDSDSVLRILNRLSYALSQIFETPASVFESFLSIDIPRVRQNGIIGFSEKMKTDRQFDSLIFDVLKTDDDPETAFEAAVALSLGGAEVLPFFESLLLQNSSLGDFSIESKIKPKIESEIEEIEQKSINESRDENLSFSQKRIDHHVLGKIIEISGDIGNNATIPLLEFYLLHSDERISNMAAESIQKIKLQS